MASDLHAIIDVCISEADRLRSYLKKSKTTQIRNSEEKAIVKATAQTWSNKHRNILLSASVAADALTNVDATYNQLIAYTDYSTSRSKYEASLKALRKELTALRQIAATVHVLPPPITQDRPPDFSLVVKDVKMQAILENRWNECLKCISADAVLAATVMMGGLLEALFLAKINLLDDKAPVYTNQKAPKDPKTKQTRPLKEWGLKDYIDVSEDLHWITLSAKDVSKVICDYRNYIHPYKELSHNVVLNIDDIHLFWDISKRLVKQLVK